jgi:hypothetical protein
VKGAADCRREEVKMFGRGVTCRQIARYLDQYGWSKHREVPEKDEKEGLVLTGWQGAGAKEFVLAIDPMVEKGCLSFKVVEALKVPREEAHLDQFLLAMAWLNFSRILGKWGYDPRDGEVRFSVDVPIDRADFTYEQFKHTLRVIVGEVEENVPLLQAIAEGRKQADEAFPELAGRTTTTLEQVLRRLLL